MHRSIESLKFLSARYFSTFQKLPSAQLLQLTHLDPLTGAVQMVDVEKDVTRRTARAHATVQLSSVAYSAALNIDKAIHFKGDIFNISRIAGIMAAKKTSEIIPLCHPIALNCASINFSCDDSLNEINIESEVSCVGSTGVEMEALFAASTSALTIYDMLKSVDKSIIIKNIYLLSKTGGKSEDYNYIKNKETVKEIDASRR